MPKGEIRCRLVAADGREWEELSAEEQNRFSGQCVQRMGAVLNDSFSRDIEMYKKVVKP